jgi:nucleotide-binding universal stress UspA family protein
MTTSHTPPPIVVGIDGSISALHAARWAAREAANRRAPLRLVHVCALLPPGYPEPVVHLAGTAEMLMEQGGDWLREAVGAIRAVDRTLDVTSDVRHGAVVKVLLEESESASLLVLGSRGLGGFAELLVGSIAVAMAGHARCPVVVARSSTVDEPPPTRGPVVVGVDGSALSDAAVGFAFEAAAARGVPLLAVHTWLDVEMSGAWTPLPTIVDWAEVHANEERVLDERLAGWQEKYPTVEVERIVSKDRPARALLRRAENAQLVVVGSRGRGALIGLGLGSVSQKLLHHAPCPVAVIRPEKSSS